MNCILCQQYIPAEYQLLEQYWHCPICDLRFLDPKFRLSSDEEKSRYALHNNDIEDVGYQKFIQPLILALNDKIKIRIQLNQTPLLGLDFGCGTGPIFASEIQKQNLPIHINLYDPYFHADESALNTTYDFIGATEVVEHFYQPHLEFQQLHDLLKPGGFIGIMTLLIDETIDFKNWFYRKDPTHVVFYSKMTFAWIQNHYGFRDLLFHDGRTIVLTRF